MSQTCCYLGIRYDQYVWPSVSNCIFEIQKSTTNMTEGMIMNRTFLFHHHAECQDTCRKWTCVKQIHIRLMLALPVSKASRSDKIFQRKPWMKPKSLQKTYMVLKEWNLNKSKQKTFYVVSHSPLYWQRKRVHKYIYIHILSHMFVIINCMHILSCKYIRTNTHMSIANMSFSQPHLESLHLGVSGLLVTWLVSTSHAALGGSIFLICKDVIGKKGH